jgi:hypothetical protein
MPRFPSVNMINKPQIDRLHINGIIPSRLGCEKFSHLREDINE